MVNRGEEKVRVRMNVVPRSTGRGFDSHRGQKIFSLPRVVPCFPLLGLTPSGLFMGLKGPSQPHLCFGLHERIWLLYFIRSLSKQRKITVKLLKIIKHTFRITTCS